MASDIDRNYFSDNNINSVHSSHHSLNFSGHSDEDSSNDEFHEDEPFSPITLRPVKTIADKQDQMNSMFGIKPFASVITTKIKVKQVEATKQRDLLLQKLGNILWVIFCGWWISIIYCLVGGLLFLTYIGRFYGSNCFTFAKYYLWPFEKFVMVESFEKKESHFSCSPSYALWAIIAWPILSIVHSVSWIICWAGIVSIPMAKLNERALQIMLRNDWKLLMVSKDTTTNSEVLLYTISATNLNYTSYTIGGMNIILVNMLPFVFFTLLVSYVPYFLGITVYPTLIFILCLISIIPLSYYLGFALASLSAQTSFAVGAILNATFGSLIELILYFFALSTGSLNSLVQAGITGTLLAMMLLLPGLSMIFGGLKYKEQRFNPAAAGVSSILLLLSVVGAFTPTIFYQAYGHFVMSCFDCSYSDSTYVCEECTWSEGNLDSDLTYIQGAKPLMYVCGAILPISYLIGLIFTLKTHAHVIDNTEFETHEETGPAPLWTKKKCIVMLLIGITLFSLVAEAMVTSLEPTLEKIGLSQVFAGFTIFALIPSVAEIVNAIQFALANKFSMSLEIGNSAAIQVSLIQMPILILFGALVSPNNASAAFTLIFPLLDLFAVLISVIIVNYISIDGKANYFLGCSLVICYALISAAFYYVT